MIKKKIVSKVSSNQEKQPVAKKTIFKTAKTVAKPEEVKEAKTTKAVAPEAKVKKPIQSKNKVTKPVQSKEKVKDSKKTKTKDEKKTSKKPTAGRIQLKSNTKTNSKKFLIPDGGRCTQEAFTQELYEVLIQKNFEVNKKTVQEIQEAVGLTLRKVLNKSSFYDKFANIYYRNVKVAARVYNPPRSEHETLVLEHNEIKVQEIIQDKSVITFEGEKIEEGEFKTTDGDTISYSTEKSSDEPNKDEDVRNDSEDLEDDADEEEQNQDEDESESDDEEDLDDDDEEDLDDDDEE